MSVGEHMHLTPDRLELHSLIIVVVVLSGGGRLMGPIQCVSPAYF